jgi:hypothetical protein
VSVVIVGCCESYLVKGGVLARMRYPRCPPYGPYLEMLFLFLNIVREIGCPLVVYDSLCLSLSVTCKCVSRVGSHVVDRWCCSHFRSSKCWFGLKVRVVGAAELGHVRASGVREGLLSHHYPFISDACAYMYFETNKKRCVIK